MICLKCLPTLSTCVLAVELLELRDVLRAGHLAARVYPQAAAVWRVPRAALVYLKIIKYNLDLACVDGHLYTGDEKTRPWLVHA